MPSETPYNSVIAAPRRGGRSTPRQHPTAPRRPAHRLGTSPRQRTRPDQQGQHQRLKGAQTGPYNVTHSRATPRPNHQGLLHTPLHRLSRKLRSRAAAECASRPRGAARARGAARMTPPARPPTRRGLRAPGTPRPGPRPPTAPFVASGPSSVWLSVALPTRRPARDRPRRPNVIF